MNTFHNLTLSYIGMNFSQLFNGNDAIIISILGAEPIAFNKWYFDTVEEIGNLQADLKSHGITEFSITYESGLELSFKL